MLYAYCRVSTRKQSIARQITNIALAYPAIKERNIFTEKFTGSTLERPEFQRLLKKLKEDDTVVFDSVSRMSRNAEEGFRLYQELFEAGINLVFLNEPYVNTDVYRNALSLNLPDLDLPETDNELLQLALENSKANMEFAKKVIAVVQKEQIRTAFDQAEKERTDNSERTRQGMKEKGAGKKISKALAGKPRKSPKAEKAKKIILKKSKDFNGDCTDAEVMAIIKAENGSCQRNTYYKYKKELKEENNHD